MKKDKNLVKLKFAITEEFWKKIKKVYREKYPHSRRRKGKTDPIFKALEEFVTERRRRMNPREEELFDECEKHLDDIGRYLDS